MNNYHRKSSYVYSLSYLDFFFTFRSLSALINADYPKSLIHDDESNHPTTLDYKSLLTMATRTSSSATTLLKQHHETLSLLNQPTTKRSPLITTNNDSINPTPRVNIPSTTTATTNDDSTRARKYVINYIRSIL